MIYLVRHAHADYSPDEMRPLSPSGREASGRVADMLERCNVARIVSSPYARAVQTVSPLADRLGIRIEIEADLRERRLASGARDDFLACLAATWQDFELAYPGGESSREAQARVSVVIRSIERASGGRNVVVASHGNALALFLHTLDPRIDFVFWQQMSLPDVFAVDTSQPGAWSFERVWLRAGAF